MNKAKRTLGVVLFAASFLAGPAYAGNLYGFGDSLVDDGNIPKLSGVNYPPPPYFENRFSNGPVWLEYFPGLTGLGFGAANDYAVGGALAGPLTVAGTSYDNLETAPVSLGGTAALADKPLPGFLEEVQGFAASGARLGSGDVVGVWVGANDYFAVLTLVAGGLANPLTIIPNTVQTVAQQTALGVDQLVALGGRRFIVFGLPDLGETPAFSAQGAVIAALGTQVSNAHNSTLAQYMAGVHDSTGANIIVMNESMIFNEVLKNPAAYGKTNVTDACFDTPSCVTAPTAVQNQYVFWDTVHPTTATHLLVAEYAASALNGLAALAVPAQVSAFGADAFTAQMDQRSAALRAGATGFSIDLPGQGMSGQIGGSSGLSGFFAGSYDYGRRNTIGADNGFNYNIGTFALGLDEVVAPGIAVGGAVGYGTDHGNVLNAGTVAADAYQMGLYAAFYQPNMYLNLNFAYGFDWYHNSRPGVLSPITAKPFGVTVNFGGEAGYVQHMGLFSFGPVAGLNVDYASIGAYVEQGDPALTQAVDSQGYHRVIGDLGATAAAGVPVGPVSVNVSLTATVDRLFSGNGGNFDSVFTAEPGVLLTTAYPSVAKTWGEVSGGVSTALTGRVSIGANFATTFAKSDGPERAVSGALRVAF